MHLVVQQTSNIYTYYLFYSILTTIAGKNATFATMFLCSAYLLIIG